jgi:HTH-type transcriptional regulator/antitoxin HigA
MRVEVVGISNDEDYAEARAVISSLMESERPEDVARLRAQAILVAAWEKEKWPPVPPTPIEAIRFRMEQMGLKPKDLVPAFGTRSRVSEVLAGKRKLSIAMIRRLNSMLGIPLDVLTQEAVGPARRRRTGGMARNKKGAVGRTLERRRIA